MDHRGDTQPNRSQTNRKSQLPATRRATPRKTHQQILPKGKKQYVKNRLQNDDWKWAKTLGPKDLDNGGAKIPNDVAERTCNKYKFWQCGLVSSRRVGAEFIRPVDPSGVIRTFDVTPPTATAASHME